MTTGGKRVAPRVGTDVLDEGACRDPQGTCLTGRGSTPGGGGLPVRRRKGGRGPGCVGVRRKLSSEGGYSALRAGAARGDRGAGREKRCGV